MVRPGTTLARTECSTDTDLVQVSCPGPDPMPGMGSGPGKESDNRAFSERHHWLTALPKMVSHFTVAVIAKLFGVQRFGRVRGHTCCWSGVRCPVRFPPHGPLLGS